MQDFFNAVFIFFLKVFIFFLIIGIVLFLYLLRHWFAKFYYFLEDTTTGFIKVRERLKLTTAQNMYDLGQQPVDDKYLGYNLELGETADTITEEILKIPGSLRSTHMYVVGASGTGKSSLLKNLLIQDIQSGMGLCVIDPHGDLVHDLIPFLGNRKEDTFILDLEDTDHMLAYNPLERRDGVIVSEQVGKLILAFKRIWGDSWGPRMEDILRHTLTLLVEQEYTLAEFQKVLVDADFRNMLVENSAIDQTKEFFVHRFEKLPSKEKTTWIEPSLNKVSAFLSDRRIGARLSQPKSSFSVKEIMDSGGILLVNIAKGRLAGNADLVGALLMSDIEMSFLSREKENRNPFALYVDEFQNIATESFDTVLAEARKFGLCLTMAHQSLKQLDDRLVSLILGNAQTQVYFRVSRQDAERLAKESENIVAKFADRGDELVQEMEEKFTLAELWEIAFHNLSRLGFRDAYVLVKGVFDHPELIKTMDTPFIEQEIFPFSDEYTTLDNLDVSYKARKEGIENVLKEYVKKDKKKPESKDDEKPSESLEFLDTQPSG